jgi:hypothetical protein
MLVPSAEHALTREERRRQKMKVKTQVKAGAGARMDDNG